MPKADIWSLGTVILELCAFDLKLLNSSLSQEEIKGKVNKPLGNLEGKYKASLVALINKTLRLDPNERPTLEEIKAELEENFAQNFVNFNADLFESLIGNLGFRFAQNDKRTQTRNGSEISSRNCGRSSSDVLYNFLKGFESTNTRDFGSI